MSEAPTKIWLQTGCEDAGCYGDCAFSELEGVSWCEEQIHNDDIKYIRADLVDGLVEAVEKVLRISDRNHDAWYAARAALAALKEEE